ncbi:MAG: hypothetical protein GVY36_17105 [Verrucomicrobia bacterium]|jgi:hypothetical protein|nr:hypothetical protein [Verrucomicrobiota bacterium]
MHAQLTHLFNIEQHPADSVIAFMYGLDRSKDSSEVRVDSCKPLLDFLRHTSAETLTMIRD